MFNIKDINTKTILPADYNLLEKLNEKFLSISYNEINSNMDLYKVLYEKINVKNSKSNFTFNNNDLQELLKIINLDYSRSGVYRKNEEGVFINPLAEQNGWNTFKSHILMGGNKVELEHRLYLGVRPDYIYLTAIELYNMFKENHIPFYFKTNGFNNIERTDNIVIYTSTEYLDKTIKILESIKQKQGVIFETATDTSILTGKIIDKVGYGFEDDNAIESYSEKIVNSYLESVDKSLIQFDNKNPEVFNIYLNKLDEYKIMKEDPSQENIRKLILFKIALEYNSEFKTNLLINFRESLMLRNLNINNICMDKITENKINKFYKIDQSKSSEEEISTIITLKDGTTMEFSRYLKLNRVSELIPLDSVIYLKNGATITSEEFMRGLPSRIYKFNSFQELFMYYIDKVERNTKIL